MKSVKKYLFTTMKKPQVRMAGKVSSEGASILILTKAAIVACMNFFEEKLLVCFVILVLIFLLLGIAHTMITKYWMKGINTRIINCATFVVTVFIGLFVYFSFLSKTALAPYALIIASSAILFPLPFFGNSTFNGYLEIPEAIYRPLVIERLEDVIGTLFFRESAYGIHWIFESTKEEQRPTDLPKSGARIFAPDGFEKVTLAHMFKGFLLHYQRQIDTKNPIQYKYKDQFNEEHLYEWFFYQKNKWTGDRQVLNSKLSFNENKIQFKKWNGEDKRGVKRRMSIATIYVNRVKKIKTPIMENSKNTPLSAADATF